MIRNEFWLNKSAIEPNSQSRKFSNCDTYTRRIGEVFLSILSTLCIY